MANRTKAASGASYALFVLFAINLLNFFDRQLPGALAEPIRKEFHLSDTALGVLGTIALLMYALVGLPLGRLADRWYRTRLIAIGTGVWSLLTGASGLAQSYSQLFISRLGVGLGEATCAPAGQSLIGDLYPPHQRARAMGVFMLGLPAGMFLAYFSAGAIGAAIRLAQRHFYSPACPVCCLRGLALRMPEPVRGALDGRSSATAAAAVEAPFRAVLRLPTMWWIILSGIFHNFNMYAINAFQTPFLQRFHDMGLKASQQCLSHLGGRCGRDRPAGGRLACRQDQCPAPQRPPAAVGRCDGNCGALHFSRDEPTQGRHRWRSCC